MTGSVTFTPTEADYVAALQAHYVQQVRKPRTLLRLSLVPVLGGALLAGLILAVDHDGAGAITFGLGAACCSALFLGLVIGLNLLLLPRRSRRLYKQQKSLHYETSFAWDDEGAGWTSALGVSRYPWQNYHVWLATDANILLYLNDNFMHFIPRRVLGTAADDLIATAARAGVPRR